MCLLGDCPCGKRGKKGITFIVQFEPSLKSIALRPKGNLGGIDILLQDRMTVLPPTIHPETGQPYEWVGDELLNTNLSDLPELSKDKLQLMQAVMSSEHIETICSGSATHDAVLSLCASLVAYADDDRIIELITALLPEDYRGDSLEELPKMLSDARAKGFDNPKSRPPLDLFIAQQLHEEFDPLLYVPGDNFYHYREGHWSIIQDYFLERRALDLLIPWLKNQQAAPVLGNIVRCLRLNVVRADFGKRSDFICFKNGTLNVRTGKLVAWSPDHELRYQLPFDYDAQAICPTYNSQLSETLMGDEKAMQTFEEFSGLTLIPEMGLQKALYLIGEAGSGKSVLLQAVEAMHDVDAVSVTRLDKIDDERYLTDVAMKLVCISYDVQTDQKVFGEAFIRITGGDPIATRKLFQEVVGRVAPTVRFMGSMNPDLPRFIAAPDALRRRLILLQCGGRVESPDPHRADKIREELPGILVRWVAALSRLLEREHFDLPEQSALEVDDYVLTQNPVQAFVADNLEADDEGDIAAAFILSQYQDWADDTGERRLSANVLGKKLKAAGIKATIIAKGSGKDRKTVRVYRARWKSNRIHGAFRPEI